MSSAHCPFPQCTIQGKSSWPELIGADVNKAVNIIKKENPNLHVVLLKMGQSIPVPEDCTRVLVFYDNVTNKVGLVPIVC
ncbi:hypothetical protein A4A49_24925 [Nicotiana attenuata]|uniref:Uncharacterized protein n=1 Tax=Nicotiana attenuata TaxID=49451 RepID=A0A1J6IR79_NICAT|nr:hypothetical protein A4A49_24925 [Nicotiana attenuata]